MSTKRLALALFLCLFVHALVAPTAADAGIWRWIEELSGPGPFKGATLEFRVKCWRSEDLFPPEKPEPEKPEPVVRSLGVAGAIKTQCLSGARAGKYPRVSLNVEAGYLSTSPANNPILYDDDQPRRVTLYPIEAIVYWQPVLGLEIGAGGGVFIFSNPRATFATPIIEPMRVDIRPFDAFLPKRADRMSGFWWRSLRALGLRQSFVFLPKEIDAADFGGGAGNTFREKGEIIKSFEIVIDFFPIFRKLPNSPPPAPNPPE
jgi:hypothetical protein